MYELLKATLMQLTIEDLILLNSKAVLDENVEIQY